MPTARKLFFCLERNKAANIPAKKEICYITPQAQEEEKGNKNRSCEKLLFPFKGDENKLYRS
jgi:hypothetical protein